MTYLVRSTCMTLQGEGARQGRAAVLCRFSGCNLWTGREEDRAGSICSFCDTDFVGTTGPGGGRFEAAKELSQHIEQAWLEAVVEQSGTPYVVFTGGEPLLQLDEPLIEACHELGFEVAIETNGTLRCPPGVDWICVSPKSIERLVQRSGNELKLVHPQSSVSPKDFEGMEFEHFYLQPRDGAERERHLKECLTYCLQHPRWRLSLQMHKVVGIP